ARCTAPWMERLIADAKRVRAHHLTGIGGRSYGQIAQRRLADCSHVALLGSGRLARGTVPSLADHVVDLFCRRPESAADFADRYSFVTIHALDEPLEPVEDSTAKQGMIVAAPMTAAEIVSWIERSGRRVHAIV